MSELGKKITGAMMVVENSLAAEVRDFESGIGAFFSGGHAKTHEVEAVRERGADEGKEEQKEGDTQAVQQLQQQPAESAQQTDYGQGL